MFLTEASVLHYLLDRRFADLDSVVGGEFTVRNLSRRNCNFRVICGAREYLVKQAGKWTLSGRETLDREAALYWRAKTDPRFLSLRALVPQSYGYDPTHSILILEFLPEERELYGSSKRFAPALASIAGAAMGAMHRDLATDEIASLFEGPWPWYLSALELNPADLEEASEGQREFLRLVKRYPEFERCLGSLRAGWRQEALIHGDWKLENCLLSADEDHLRVVDWELAVWGDPLADVGTLLQSYWNFWVVWPTRFGLAEIQPALRAFLEAYAGARGLDPLEVATRATRFAAAAMLQSAYESLYDAPGMQAEAVRLSQASLNILSHPEWAARELIGTN